MLCVVCYVCAHWITLWITVALGLPIGLPSHRRSSGGLAEDPELSPRRKVRAYLSFRNAPLPIYTCMREFLKRASCDRRPYSALSDISAIYPLSRSCGNTIRFREKSCDYIRFLILVYSVILNAL